MFWNIVIGIASFVLNLVLAPKPQNAKAASLEDFEFPVAEEGLEIPVVFGTVNLRGPNVVWYGDLKIKDIKGARRYGLFGPRQVLGHKYYLGVHMVLCHGVHDEIDEIWIGDKLAFGQNEIFDGAGSLYIDKPELFGGEQSEGGVQGTISIMTGSPAQGQNAYLVDVYNSSTIPAFRGIVSVVLEQPYLSTSPYIKAWEFVLKRIHKTSAGVEQWYDGKAAVPYTHAQPDTGTGVVLINYSATMNSISKIDSSGPWAARVGEYYQEGGGTPYPTGALRIWHLPEGTSRVHNPGTATPGIGRYMYSSMVHFTEFGELMVTYGGDIWAGSDIYVQWLDPDAPWRILSQINITQEFKDWELLHGPGSLSWVNINWGGVTGEWGNYILFHYAPNFAGYGYAPWVLFHRSDGGTWSIVYIRPGIFSAASVGGSDLISMGPVWAYLFDGHEPVNHCILRIRWHPDDSYVQEFVPLEPLGFPTDGRVNMHCVAYWPSTDEVIVTTSDGIYVFDSELTVLKRSRQFSLYYFAYRPHPHRFAASNTTILLKRAAYIHSHQHMLEINISTLETVNDMDLNLTSYVNKIGYPEGYILFNRDVHGLVIGQHFHQMSFWPYQPVLEPDMNPSHIIRECLTDKTWGMGYNDADIDDASFTAAANVLWDECFGLSLTWTREERIEEFITVILAHIDAYLYLRRDTGKFFLKLIRQDYDTASLQIVTEDDIVMWDEVVRRGPAEAVNSVTVKYTDRTNRGKDATHQYDNIAQIQQIGARINALRSYPGISHGDLAVRVAVRDQKSLGVGMISGRFTGKRTLDRLYPGDPFRLVSDRHNMDGEVMRVASMRFGDGRQNRIGMKFVEDVFQLNANELVDTSATDWENPSNPPDISTPRLVWEMPYREMLILVGETHLIEMLTADPNAGVMEVAGGRTTTDSLDATIYTDGVAYEIIGFSPCGLLGASVTALETSIVLTDDVDLSLIVVGQLAALTGGVGNLAEIIRIDAVSGITLTVSRGFMDTIPRAHTAGEALVAFEDNAGSDYVQRTTGDVISVELSTRTGQGSLSLALAPDDELTFGARVIRPLRPAGVLVNSQAEGTVDATALSTIPVTWTRRNRISDAASPRSWLDADDTPETGQTTVVQTLDDNLVVLNTVTGLVGTSYSVPISAFSGEPSGWLKVGSTRDGYREWQGWTLPILVDDLWLEDEGDVLYDIADMLYEDA